MDKNHKRNQLIEKLNADPKNVSAMFELALLSDAKQAVRILQRALTVEPNNNEAIRYLRSAQAALENAKHTTTVLPENVVSPETNSNAVPSDSAKPVTEMPLSSARSDNDVIEAEFEFEGEESMLDDLAETDARQQVSVTTTVARVLKSLGTVRDSNTAKAVRARVSRFASQIRQSPRIAVVKRQVANYWRKVSDEGNLSNPRTLLVIGATGIVLVAIVTVLIGLSFGSPGNPASPFPTRLAVLSTPLPTTPVTTSNSQAVIQTQPIDENSIICPEISLELGGEKIVDEQALRDELQQQGRVEVIIGLSDPVDISAPAEDRIPAVNHCQEQLLAQLAEGFERTDDFTYVPAVAGIITNISLLDVLKSAPIVISVYRNQHTSIEFDQNQLDSTPSATESTTAIPGGISGFDGAGIVVAVIDSGIESSHPELTDSIVAEECFVTLCRNSHTAPDESGHGTHVAGIITSPSGIAPSASIAALRVTYRQNNSDIVDAAAVLEALNWVKRESNTLNIRLVNMSLHIGDLYSDYCDSEPQLITNKENYVLQNIIS